MTKLSIITINRNNADGLRKTIESVVSQTYTDFEYIIIDGASTDESVDVIKEYADKITFWVSEPDNGIYNAMNKGILKAKGEYLQFLNSGDWLSDCVILERIFSKKHMGDVLYGNCKLVLDHVTVYDFLVPQKITLAYFYSGRSINHQSTFFKRQLFHNNMYDETYKIVSDWKYYFTLIIRGAIFEYIDCFVVYFDYNGIGATIDSFHDIERQRCLDEVIPAYIRSDYEELTYLKYRFTEFEKSKYHLLRTKSRYYRKLIKIFLSFLTYVDLFVSKLWRKSH